MSEIKKVASPMANTMMVLDQGEELLRSPSGLTRRPLKKATSEGLISLSAEPGKVKFEVGNQTWLESEGTRCSSAGRIERKLQLFKKKEDSEEQRRNSTDGIFFKPQDNPLVTKISTMKISSTTTTEKTKLLQDEKPSKAGKHESESSESESDSDESESDNEEAKENDMSNDENKEMVPIEIKAEFIQCVMSGNYTKAQETCKQILLLEPDNATCKEFHSVIMMKIEQDNMEDSDEDDSEDDDDDDEEDDDDDGEDDNDEEESNTSSSSEESEEDTDDDEFTVAPGLNLIMGGLPIKPQAK
ncbi:transcription initiation factor TFIID subunit 11-like [Actinia tenebrosa]|uniref:Transcription initiation factor TFIID subunit 11-like n=1 Tax=Actinia tenebrosa TaxID=6105 RepID=A0A6P8IW07_ACTTE|nr:transcription initiation factor TFIID subunit 11-like [Actinia tenebrosa]